METAFIIKSLTAMIFRGDENLAPNKQTRKFQYAVVPTPTLMGGDLQYQPKRVSMERWKTTSSMDTPLLDR